MSSLRDSYDSIVTNISEQKTENFFRLAEQEILAQYGHRVKVNRKTLRKYGRNKTVGTTEVDITSFNTTEVYLSTNGIDTISSSDAGDTGQVYIEGMTISGGILTFVSEIVTLNGQNKVTLAAPLARCTRMRGNVAGDVYVYEDTAISGGVPTDTSKIHNAIVPEDNTSLKAGTSVSGTNYFILAHYWATLGKASASNAADIRFKIQQLDNPIFGNNFYTEEVWSISLSSPLEQPVRPFEIIPPNTDLMMTGSASSGTLDIKAGFHGYFADIIE